MSNTVELIAQDKSNACWLASSTMMETWKTGVHFSLTNTLKILDSSGTSFTNIYDNNGGLAFADNQKITSILGLTSLPPASYAIEYLTSILDSSPLMAVIMYSSSSMIAHIIVITGISGDGTPEGTSLSVNDPLPLNNGNTYTIAFNDFLNKFEQVVAYENNFPDNDLTSQLFYFKQQSSSANSSGNNANDSSSSDQLGDTNAGNDNSSSGSSTGNLPSTDSSSVDPSEVDSSSGNPSSPGNKTSPDNTASNGSTSSTVTDNTSSGDSSFGNITDGNNQSTDNIFSGKSSDKNDPSDAGKPRSDN